jgi:prevent-host-death family protein
VKNISISNDIIPVGEFKSKLAFYLNEIQEKGNALVITQNGKPAGVLLSPGEFDMLQDTKRFVESVARGLSDSETGDVYTTAQVKAQLRKKRTR